MVREWEWSVDRNPSKVLWRAVGLPALIEMPRSYDCSDAPIKLIRARWCDEGGVYCSIGMHRWQHQSGAIINNLSPFALVNLHLKIRSLMRLIRVRVQTIERKGTITHAFSLHASLLFCQRFQPYQLRVREGGKAPPLLCRRLARGTHTTGSCGGRRDRRNFTLESIFDSDHGCTSKNSAQFKPYKNGVGERITHCIHTADTLPVVQDLKHVLYHQKPFSNSVNLTS